MEALHFRNVPTAHGGRAHGLQKPMVVRPPKLGTRGGGHSVTPSCVPAQSCTGANGILLGVRGGFLKEARWAW